MACTLQVGITIIFAVVLGNEGPIRSRLVENGYLGEGDSAKGVRQGSVPRAWPQQNDPEANAFSGPPVNSNRPMVGNTGQRSLHAEQPRIIQDLTGLTIRCTGVMITCTVHCCYQSSICLAVTRKSRCLLVHVPKENHVHTSCYIAHRCSC